MCHEAGGSEEDDEECGYGNVETFGLRGFDLRRFGLDRVGLHRIHLHRSGFQGLVL